MPKYLIQGSYTTEGVKGLLKEGGTGRRGAAEALAKSVGGSIEAFYFAFGSDDFVVIADAPSNAAAARISLAGAGSEAITLRTTPLLTPDEMDEAVKESADYRPPGT